ncbi:hypothetical protein ABK040_008337 [Willaertia magna]
MLPSQIISEDLRETSHSLSCLIEKLKDELNITNSEQLLKDLSLIQNSDNVMVVKEKTKEVFFKVYGIQRQRTTENNKEFKQQVTELNDRLYFQLAAIMENIKNMTTEIITKTINNYFPNNSQLLISEKVKGRQFGYLVKVLQNNCDEMNLFVKTHSRGLVRSDNLHSNIPTSVLANFIKPVSSAELLVYKILEKTQLGPKVLFSYLDSNWFFIISFEAGYVQPLMKNKYMDYHKYKKEEIYNNFIQLLSEQNVKEDALPTALINILDGILKVDALTKLFALKDTVANHANFGIIFNEEGIPEGCKLIDFDLLSDEPPIIHSDYGVALLSNFLMGQQKDRIIHHSKDYLIQYGTSIRSVEKRIKILLQFLEESKLQNVILEAYQEIKQELPQEILVDLDIYKDFFINSVVVMTKAARSG